MYSDDDDDGIEAQIQQLQLEIKDLKFKDALKSIKIKRLEEQSKNTTQKVNLEDHVIVTVGFCFSTRSVPPFNPNFH